MYVARVGSEREMKARELEAVVEEEPKPRLPQKRAVNPKCVENSKQKVCCRDFQAA